MIDSTSHLTLICQFTIGIAKKLDKLASQKDCGDIALWKQSIINHLYWSAASTTDGDGKVVVAKWTSVINHIQNQHSHDNELYPECQHPPLDDEGRRKKWLQPSRLKLFIYMY